MFTGRLTGSLRPPEKAVNEKEIPDGEHQNPESGRGNKTHFDGREKSNNKN